MSRVGSLAWGAAGNSTENVAPPWSLFAATMVAGMDGAPGRDGRPWACTIQDAMARPNPEPPPLRAWSAR
jgi:hypothetical protein